MMAGATAGETAETSETAAPTWAEGVPHTELGGVDYGDTVGTTASPADAQIGSLGAGVQTIVNEDDFDLNAILNSGTGVDVDAEPSSTAVADPTATQPPTAEGTPSFLQQLMALQDDDPTVFHDYNDVAPLATGECMGGFITDLDLYLDCETMVGFLAIVNVDDPDLSKLSKLTSITSLDDMVGPDGNGLVITNNTNLLSTDGLGNLALITGGVEVMGNPVLTNPTIGQMGMMLSLGTNDQGNSITFVNNALLTDIYLPETVIPGGILVASNELLTHITAEALTEMGGALSVMDNALLGGINMPLLSSVGNNTNGDSLVVLSNGKLQNLDELKDLQGALAGAIKISLNPMLANIDGLNKVISCGQDGSGVSLSITGNAVLGSVDGLAGMEGSVPGAVVVIENPSLKTLAGLQGISEIGADEQGSALEIKTNKALKDLLGFSGLETVDGGITIEGNDALTTLHGLENIKSINGRNKYGNSLEILWNDNLVEVGSLEALIQLQGGLLIENNPLLESIVPIETGLQAVGDVTVSGVECLSQAEQELLGSLSSASSNVTVSNAAASCPGSTWGNPAQMQTGAGAQSLCGGTAADAEDWKEWKQFGSAGIYVDVDTSSCHFDETTPRYTSTVHGDSAHWQLTGVNSIYEPTATGFRLYAYHPVMRGSFMMFFAKKYSWRVSWMADSGKTSGISTAGNSGWKQPTSTNWTATNVLYLDVNTQKSEFETTLGAPNPTYVTSLHGTQDHWKAYGAHAIYAATATGFRVFVVYPDAIQPAFAETNKWAVAYIGSTDLQVSGQSSSNWNNYDNAAEGTDAPTDKALYIDVDTSQSHFTEVPAYVASMQGTQSHWMVTGAGSVYRATATSFRIYLDKANTPEFAQTHQWRVNYIAVPKATKCVVSQWSGWAACSKTCGHDSVQTRTRIVQLEAEFGGSCDMPLTEDIKCPKPHCDTECTYSTWTAWTPCSVNCGLGTATRQRTLVLHPSGFVCDEATAESTSCDAGPCAVHCDVSEWTAWSTCSKSCGSGTTLRSRTVLTFPVDGGFACPDLEQQLGCNTQACAVDCVTTDWDNWSVCTVSCGWGLSSRTRTATAQNKWGGAKCGALSDYRPCHIGFCPVNCTVTDWPEDWGACTKSCGGGDSFRHRSVVTASAFEGTICPALTEKEGCNAQSCPVDCIVSEWSGFSTCTLSCGGGTQTATRTVITTNNDKGVDCPLLSQTQECGITACPVDCKLSAWTGWSSCSETCGAGTQWRMRKIDIAASSGGQQCSDRFELQACDDGVCPVNCQFTNWTSWTTCHKTCGTSVQIRGRSIQVEASTTGTQCPSLQETRECMTMDCPEDCIVGAWGLWDTCSTSCGTGERFRTRPVLRAVGFGGKLCAVTEDREECNTHDCPTNCEVSAWSVWSTWSATCGDAVRARTRTVVAGETASYGGSYCPPTSQTQTNQLELCPEHCIISAWQDWTACSRSCNGGFKKRTRTTEVYPVWGDHYCPANEEIAACNDQPCPGACELSSWSAWSACSKTCGTGGFMVRVREVAMMATNGGMDCEGAVHESGSCDTIEDAAFAPGPCPSHCQVAAWGAWSQCTQTCGTGTQHRERDILYIAAHGGAECPITEEQQQCNTHFCPVDCQLSYWDSASMCSVSCGTGTATRTRYVLAQPQYGGRVCSALKMEFACEMGPCPVHCEVSPFGVFGVCSKSCGRGLMLRTRTVLAVSEEFQSSSKICPALVESRECNAQPCPQDCAVSAWEEWVTCSKSCGNGSQKRARTVEVVMMADGKECPTLAETRSCNNWDCPVDCSMSEWSAWSSCSSSCGEDGTTQRVRRVLAVGGYGGKACGSTKDGKVCNNAECPVHCVVSGFTEWSSCSRTCGIGEQMKTRYVLTEATSEGQVCPELTWVRACNSAPCPIDCVMSAWGMVTACSASCYSTGGLEGVQMQRRKMIRTPENGGVACGATDREGPCNRHACPVDCHLTDYGGWGACSQTCGWGVKTRSREVATATANGGRGCGPLVGSDLCYTPCAVHCKVGAWGTWSECSTSCGTGKRTRSRSVIEASDSGGLVCPELTEQDPCNTLASELCAQDCRVADWQEWTTCSASCGGGTQEQHRLIFVSQAHGGVACPHLIESRECGTQSCPIDCVTTAWAAWGDCSATCGIGQERRTRLAHVNTPEFGGSECPDLYEDRSCNVGPCPVHCSVSDFGDWTDCTKSCDYGDLSGTSSRKRTVTEHANHGGSQCPQLIEIKWCNQHACPVDCTFSDWSAWLPYADGGNNLRRTRSIATPVGFGGVPCSASDQVQERKMCPTAIPDATSPWSKQCPTSCICGQCGKRFQIVTRTFCSSHAMLKYKVHFRREDDCQTKVTCIKDDAVSTSVRRLEEAAPVGSEVWPAGYV
jgi:hypothetical protein